MEVLDFINSNENWEEILTGDPWHIRVSRDGDYVLLKYNQLDSDFSLNIVRECRGAIFYKNDDGKYECVCRALNKFGNYGEAYVPNIDWDSVVVEEKVDGCFSGENRVLLADGSTMKIKTIVNNKKDVKVLSYNFNTGKIESKKVIGWHKSNNKRPLSDWVTIELKHIKTSLHGKFSQHCVITPTKNHVFYIKRGNVIQEIMADQLKVGDVLLTPTKSLTPVEKQVILGTLLGDGSCTYYKEEERHIDKGIRFSHSRKQEEYVNFKYSLLKRLGGQVQNIFIQNSYGHEKTCYQSHVNGGIYSCYNLAYQNGHKQVNREWLENLNWLGFAIWYMDDGSLNTACKNNSIHLHTEGFTKEEVALIRDFYCKKGYKTYMRCYNNYYMINFSTEASERIWIEIRKYIPECMQYKLPERHRGFFEPIIDTVEPEIVLTEGYIESIQEGLYHHNIYHENELYSYDIEVEDNHNYFCQGCLVHNSLIKTWNHSDQWHFSTNGMIDAFKATYDDLENSFGDLVKEALVNEDNMQSLLDSLDKNYTYMFELVSPKVQMTCYYPETKLYYLGQRDMRTMKESKKYTEQMKRCGVLTPKIYPLTTLEECLSYVKCMTKDEEGFVIKDKNFNRMKLKSPQYLMAFHMNNNGAITTKRIIKIMKNDMLDDFVAYCPQYQGQVDEVVKMIELIAQDLNNTWAQAQKVYSENRKEFAENICMFKYQDYIWARYDGWFDNAIDYIMNMTNNRIVRLIKQKKNEVGC